MAILGLQHNWVESTELPTYSLSLYKQSLPYDQRPHQSGTFVLSDEPTWHINITQHPQSSIELTFGVHFMGLDKSIMTCIFHYSTIQNSFAALKIAPFPLTPTNH